jgi:hypothetical protein
VFELYFFSAICVGVPLAQRWEEELLGAVCHLLGRLQDDLRKNAHQLPSPFQGPAIHKDPLHIHRLAIKNKLTDPSKCGAKLTARGSKIIKSAFFRGVRDPTRG